MSRKLALFETLLLAVLAQQISEMKTGGLYNETCPVPFPFSACEPGSWATSDPEMVSATAVWWPGRSTHYGSTAGGSCGMDNFPNCFLNESCGGAPKVILNNSYAGYYAAPQGDYFAQIGGYLSCNECFEVKCVDSQCKSTGPVYLRIADACPCDVNNKWCCGNWSMCASEQLADLDGYPHCARSTNGIWVNEHSLHLDLNDAAMAVLAPTLPGSINTMVRRVPCEVQGSVHILLTSSIVFMSDCVTIWPDKSDCIWYLAFSVLNVAGTGSVTSVEVYTKIVANNSITYGWLTMNRDPNSPSTKPQEKNGKFVIPNSTPLYYPFYFRIGNRLGQVVTSKVFQNSSGWSAAGYIDLGVQFPMPSAESFYGSSAAPVSIVDYSSVPAVDFSSVPDTAVVSSDELGSGASIYLSTAALLTLIRLL